MEMQALRLLLIMQAFSAICYSLSYSLPDTLQRFNKMQGFQQEYSETYEQYYLAQQPKLSGMYAASDSLQNHIESLRERIIRESGGENDGGRLNNHRDAKTPTQIMIVEGMGELLREKIQTTRDTILSYIPRHHRDSIASILPLTAEYHEAAAQRLGKKNWSEYLFEDIPVIAVNTILQKFQQDARNSEKMIEQYLEEAD